MTYTFDQLKEDVRKEAEALRVHATKEERGRLDLKRMDPNSPIRCYYGLMTGECDSERATELIKKCASVYINNDSSFGNMTPVEEFRYYYWSPVEWYITYPEARNANLIAFLRGETDNLEL